MADFTAKVRTDILQRPLQTMVRHIVKLAHDPRKRVTLLAPRWSMSEVGRCTHAELLLGCWLYLRDSAALSAEVLMTAVARLPSDDRAVTIMRMEQGRLVGSEMIRAFVGDREIGRALQFAAVIVSRYPGTVYAKLAKRLFRELPYRMNDFLS